MKRNQDSTLKFFGFSGKTNMTWFEEFFGFAENPGSIRQCLSIDKDEESGEYVMTALRGSKTNQAFKVGRFTTPSVASLVEEIGRLEGGGGASKATFMNVSDDIRSVHHKAAVLDSSSDPPPVIQAASQFNCLEMVGPSVSPNSGVTQYIRDRTQGPACALSCPSGTVFRNYFVNGTGQCSGVQLNTLDGVEAILGSEEAYYDMRNGYAMPRQGKMKSFASRLMNNPELEEELVSAIKVGVHWGTPVVNKEGSQVCQIYASACPMQYAKNTTQKDWKEFATIVLNGMYEATLAAAVLISRQHENARVKVYLTLLGGGAFGNPMTWILQAIERAVVKYKNEPLDVKLVHYSPPGSRFVEFAKDLSKRIKK